MHRWMWTAHSLKKELWNFTSDRRSFLFTRAHDLVPLQALVPSHSLHPILPAPSLTQVQQSSVGAPGPAPASKQGSWLLLCPLTICSWRSIQTPMRVSSTHQSAPAPSALSRNSQVPTVPDRSCVINTLSLCSSHRAHLHAHIFFFPTSPLPKLATLATHLPFKIFSQSFLSPLPLFSQFLWLPIQCHSLSTASDQIIHIFAFSGCS